MKQQDENLSLLLDDYSDGDVDAVLDEVIADVNLQYRVRRYQMIGEVMRNELPQAIDTGFHQRVMAEVHDQARPDELPPRDTADAPSAVPSLLGSWFKPFAGIAVAASVALVTVALWQPLQQEGSSPDDYGKVAENERLEELRNQQAEGAAVTASNRLQANGMRWELENESPVLQQKLNSYLVNHTEYSNSMQGLIPQARVAGFDAQQ